MAAGGLEMSSEKCFRRTKLACFFCAVLVVPIFYYAFQLLNNYEITNKITEQIFCVELPKVLSSEPVAEQDPERYALRQGEDYRLLLLLSSAVPHVLRTHFLVMIVLFPAIKFGLLFAMVLVPIALCLVGTRLQKLSKTEIVLTLVSVSALCLGIPLIGILLNIGLQGKLLMILP